MTASATLPNGAREPGTPPVVAMRGLSRVFDSTPPVHALREVDLDIHRGDYVSIVGPSGSGKSTLLHVMGCLDRPTAGTYHLDGIDVADLTDGERTGLRGQRLGFVFQAYHLMSHRTVRENVEAAGLYDATPRRERRRRAEEALERVGLADRIDFSPRRLSGGECQRVAIARALLTSPSLLLADEPTGNLDTATTASVLDLLEHLCDEGLTLVMVTHDVGVSQRARRVLRMVDGVLEEMAA